MKTRTDLLNHLAEKHNLLRYLEIGVQDPKQNFDKIICQTRVGVDPAVIYDNVFKLTSDQFFERIQKYDGERQMFIRQNEIDDSLNNPLPITPLEFDLIFIDGLHTAEQVEKDVFNSLQILKDGGFILLHDTNPEKEEHTIVPRPTDRGHWNGDVYKYAASVYGDIEKYTVDIDNGCTVIKKTPLKKYPREVIHNSKFEWSTFNENRKKLLNLISWEEFIEME